MAEQVAGAGGIERACGFQPIDAIGGIESFDNGACELAQRPSQFQRSARAFAAPERHDRQCPGCWDHAHAVWFNRLDAPDACSQQKSISNTPFVDKLLVEFTDAQTLCGEGRQVSRIGNGSATGEGQMLGSGQGFETIVDSVPTDTRMQGLEGCWPGSAAGHFRRGG